MARHPLQKVYGAADIKGLSAVCSCPINQGSASSYGLIWLDILVTFVEPFLKIVCPGHQVGVVLSPAGAAQFDRWQVAVIRSEYEVVDRVMLIAGQQHPLVERWCVLVEFCEARLDRCDHSGLSRTRWALDQHYIPRIDRQINGFHLGVGWLATQDGSDASGQRIMPSYPTNRVRGLVAEDQTQLSSGAGFASGDLLFCTLSSANSNLVQGVCPRQ